MEVKKKEKIWVLGSVIWLLLAVPISEDLYDEALDSGFLLRFFALALVGFPVWLVLGWRWLTNKAPIAAKFWLSTTIIGLVLAFLMELGFFSRSWQYISYIPLICVVAFLILTWVFERDRMMFWRKKTTQKKFSSHLMPTKSDLERDVRLLLQSADSIAETLYDEFKRLSNRSKPPAIINPKADAIRAAYELIHLHFLRIGFSKGGKAVMTFAAFRSEMITNYLVSAQPKFPGLPMMTSEEIMQDGKLRASCAPMFKHCEECGVTVQGNLERNSPYPFFPFYENARPYLGPQATVVELNQSFGSLYESLSGKAQESVRDFIKRQTAAISK